MSYKLFIPGPIEVSQKTYKAMTTPVFGHRSPDFVELYQSVQPGLQGQLREGTHLFYHRPPEAGLGRCIVERRQYGDTQQSCGRVGLVAGFAHGPASATHSPQPVNPWAWTATRMQGRV